MKKFKGYEAKMSQSFETLPVGGYVCEIKNAETATYTGGSELLKLSIDIAEGDYKDFYMNKWKNDNRDDKKWSGVFTMWLPKDDNSEKDQWAKNKFNNLIGCIEDANPGYTFDWDEKKLKGKKIALVFRNEEYQKSNGEYGWFVKPFRAISIGDCKDGKWGKYDDKAIENKSNSYSAPAYAPMDSEDDGNLPF